MEYLIHDGEKQTGPYTLEQLQSMWVVGAINLDTLYWAQGMKEWQKLRAIVAILQPPAFSAEAHPISSPTKQIGARSRSFQPSSKNIVRVLLAVTVVVASLAALGIWISKIGKDKPTASVSQTSDDFRQLLDKFLTDSSRLKSLSSQGTTYESFGSQLATSVASFDLLAPVWPTDYQTTAKGEFQLAVEGWQLLYQLWGRTFKDRNSDGKLPVVLNSQTVAVLEAYAPGRLKYLPKDWGILEDNYRKNPGARYNSSEEFRDFKMLEEVYSKLNQSNVRVLMGVASEHFEAGRALLLENTKR